MRLTLLIILNTCCLAFEFSAENLNKITQEITKHAADPWIYNNEIRYSIDGTLSNEKGKALERILKPGLVQIKATGSFEMTWRKEKDNDIDMITIRILSFQTDDVATDFFNKKYSEENGFSKDEKSFGLIGKETGKRAFQYKSITISIGTVKRNDKLTLDIQNAMKGVLENSPNQSVKSSP